MSSRRLATIISNGAVRVYSRPNFEGIVGKLEVIRRPDLFAGQVVNALLCRAGLSETDPRPITGKGLPDPPAAGILCYDCKF